MKELYFHILVPTNALHNYLGHKFVVHIYILDFYSQLSDNNVIIRVLVTINCLVWLYLVCMTASQ